MTLFNILGEPVLWVFYYSSKQESCHLEGGLLAGWELLIQMEMGRKTPWS
jgi:hypothetical protein